MFLSTLNQVRAKLVKTNLKKAHGWALILCVCVIRICVAMKRYDLISSELNLKPRDLLRQASIVLFG